MNLILSLFTITLKFENDIENIWLNWKCIFSKTEIMYYISIYFVDILKYHVYFGEYQLISFFLFEVDRKESVKQKLMSRSRIVWKGYRKWILSSLSSFILYLIIDFSIMHKAKILKFSLFPYCWTGQFLLETLVSECKYELFHVKYRHIKDKIKFH